MNTRRVVGRWPLVGILFSVVVGACRDNTGPDPFADAVGPPAHRVVGVAYTDPTGSIEYTAGDAPLVIVAPHGGYLQPVGLPDRQCPACILGNDQNTQELARAIADAFERRSGKRPHLVVNRLHRRKFDANREYLEATGGNLQLELPWRWLHAAIDSAHADIARDQGAGVLIDVHGHAHAVPRIELGYNVSAEQLRLSDGALQASSVLQQSSVARIAQHTISDDAPAAVLRGTRSLGSLLVTHGYRAVPSLSEPAPDIAHDYFDGGYISNRHGSAAGGMLDGILVECNFAGVRDSPEARARFADALAAALVAFLDQHYGWRSAPAARVWSVKRAAP